MYRRQHDSFPLVGMLTAYLLRDVVSAHRYDAMLGMLRLKNEIRLRRP